MAESKKHKNHTLSRDIDLEVKEIIKKELKRQKSQLILIASENFASQEVLRTMGSVPTNKYAEGYPGFRYYEGCKHIDEIEQLAIDRANKLFGSNYSNV